MPIFFFSAILYNQLPFSRVPRVSEKRGSFLLELLSRLLRNKLQEVFIFAQFEAELIYHIRIVRTVIEIDIMAVLAHIRDLEIGINTGRLHAGHPVSYTHLDVYKRQGKPCSLK